MSILSTSSINNTISAYKLNEQNKQVSPLQTRKEKYSSLSSAWGVVKSKLDTLQSTLYDLKSVTSSSIFNSKSANLANTDFFSVTAESTAISSAYTLKVDRLAKGDLAVSETFVSGVASGVSAGTHSIQVNSGDYTGTADVELDGTEDYESLMTKITNALNSDYAEISSADPGGNITNSGTLEFDINGSTTEIDYDYTNKTYAEVVDDLVEKINSDVSGVTAENDNGALKITVNDRDDYISIGEKDGTSGTLASELGITTTKEKGTGGLLSASTFSPSSGESKLSLIAKETGYDNRLILSDASGSALDSIGLTAAILADRTVTAADDNSAGFKYLANSSSNNELNSKFTFNGINIQRNSNSISDLLQGVTIDLKTEQETTDEAVSFSVSNGTDEIKGKIEEFIKNFNDAYTYVRANYFSGESGRGLFVGDPSASSLLRNLQTTALDNVSGIAAGNFNSLYDLGISFDPDIGLSITDSSTLTTAIEEDVEQVSKVFNSDDGIAKTLHTTLEDYLGFNGSISRIVESYDSNVNYYNDRITAINERIDKSASILRSKYEELQMQYAELLNMQNFFSTSGGFF